MRLIERVRRGLHRRVKTLTWRLWLRSRVGGRIKLRGDLTHLEIDPSFRCDGDLWLGIHSDQGRIAIAAGVNASGPLIITAVEQVRVGRGVLLGPNVMVTDHYHGDPSDPSVLDVPPSDRALHSRGPIVIGNFVQIGANVSILSPTTIGTSAIVGANSVVRGDLAPRTVHAGRRPGLFSQDMSWNEMNKPSYYQQHRSEILPLIKTTPSRVLDIGCGKGGVASTLRHHFQSSLSVTGFDKYKDEAFDYSSVFDAFYNVDLMEAWPAIDYRSFDLVLLLDVLEHLTQPEAVLGKLSTLVSPGGRVIVSLPNFHFYSNLYEIVRSGRFQYRDSGILDRTHIRFFGFEDAREMISQHMDIIEHIPFQLHKTTASKLVELTLGSKYSAYQNVFLCKPRAR